MHFRFFLFKKDPFIIGRFAQQYSIYTLMVNDLKLCCHLHRLFRKNIDKWHLHKYLSYDFIRILFLSCTTVRVMSGTSVICFNYMSLYSIAFLLKILQPAGVKCLLSKDSNVHTSFNHLYDRGLPSVWLFK